MLMLFSNKTSTLSWRSHDKLSSSLTWGVHGGVVALMIGESAFIALLSGNTTLLLQVGSVLAGDHQSSTVESAKAFKNCT